MKKIILSALIAGVLSLTLTGCLVLKTESSSGQSTSETKKSKEVSADVRASEDENNTSVEAKKTVIIDWQDRTIGAKRNPEWLLNITRGNGDLYVNMYGLSEEYENHKWFCSSAQNKNKTNAQTEAELEVVYRLGQEMANTINAKLGSSLEDGQKEIIRKICSEVKDVTITGIGERGTYWQQEKTEDEYGNIQTVYNFYAIYSCTQEIYNKLLNTYMISILKSNELDATSVSALKTYAQDILNASNEKSEKLEQAKKREWINQLNYEETKRILAREETLQHQSDSFAEAAKNASAFTSLTMDNAGNAYMDPALRSLIMSEL